MLLWGGFLFALVVSATWLLHLVGDGAHVDGGDQIREPLWGHRLNAWTEGLFTLAFVLLLLLAIAIAALVLQAALSAWGGRGRAAATRAQGLLALLSASTFFALASAPIAGRGDAQLTRLGQSSFGEFLASMTEAVPMVFIALLLVVGVFAGFSLMSRFVRDPGIGSLVLALLMSLALVFAVGAGLVALVEAVRARAAGLWPLALEYVALAALSAVVALPLLGKDRRRNVPVR